MKLNHSQLTLFFLGCTFLFSLNTFAGHVTSPIAVKPSSSAEGESVSVDVNNLPDNDLFDNYMESVGLGTNNMSCSVSSYENNIKKCGIGFNADRSKVVFIVYSEDNAFADNTKEHLASVLKEILYHDIFDISCSDGYTQNFTPLVTVPDTITLIIAGSEADITNCGILDHFPTTDMFQVNLPYGLGQVTMNKQIEYIDPTHYMVTAGTNQ